MQRLIDADTLTANKFKNDISYNSFCNLVKRQPTIDAVQVVRCCDCKWWDKTDKDSSYGYCHACKHAHFSKNWEISIYRTYKSDWYCADGERKDNG